MSSVSLVTKRLANGQEDPRQEAPPNRHFWVPGRHHLSNNTDNNPCPSSRSYYLQGAELSTLKTSSKLTENSMSQMGKTDPRGPTSRPLWSLQAPGARGDHSHPCDGVRVCLILDKCGQKLAPQHLVPATQSWLPRDSRRGGPLACWEPMASPFPTGPWSPLLPPADRPKACGVARTTQVEKERERERKGVCMCYVWRG